MNRLRVWASVCVLVALCAGPMQANVVIETVPVGNPGNANDTHGDGYGGVNYVYSMGKYEVTAGQYTAFLNAVAASDLYGLYDTNMWIGSYGCKIQRSGASGSYTYTVAPDWANRPVNRVGWADAARFANWLHNGQPTGAQGLGTTEDGSYFLNGAISDAVILAVARETDATWVIPSEDEWYKAAYHKNDGVTGNYWNYPTSTDSTPGFVNDSGNLSGTGTAFTEGGADPGNYATYDGDGGTDGIGSPYYRTQVGEWENSGSPYGTFDQGGNVFEWTQTRIRDCRVVRGGSYHWTDEELRPWAQWISCPPHESNGVGFRVVEVPEPATLVILALASVGVLRRRRSSQ